MELICPECKNDVKLARFPNLKHNDMIECGWCGIALMITETGKGQWLAEVVEEGK
ncbi:MAG: hypothetical protein HYV42_01030 [Candidatus Magasanikbacteria bacterium]|nr:hypothetical protein [Candidatus Magasanikbacteria bacterium]